MTDLERALEIAGPEYRTRKSTAADIVCLMDWLEHNSGIFELCHASGSLWCVKLLLLDGWSMPRAGATLLEALTAAVIELRDKSCQR